jgi:Flp pilus assembly pilin Flp
MKNLLKRLLAEEKGQDVIEYALLAAGISIAAVPIIPNIGTAVAGLYTQVQGALPGAAAP